MLTRRTLALALAATMLTVGVAAEAEAYGPRGGYHRGYHGGYHRGGHGHWGPGLVLGGIGLGIGLGSYYNGYDAYYGAPVYPGYVVTQPPVIVYDNPVPTAPRPVPAAPAPEPVIYPRDGQSAAQTEADRQACNRWATTQPSAMADGSVFQRATLACMEGRGYTVR